MQTLQFDVYTLINSPSALTQEQGNIVYEVIASAIVNNDIVQLDFSQIESMISPFLNNAIGQLYGKFSAEEIKEHLILENFPSEKKSTLNMVISNAKKFYANKESFNSTVKEVFNS